MNEINRTSNSKNEEIRFWKRLREEYQNSRLKSINCNTTFKTGVNEVVKDPEIEESPLAIQSFEKIKTKSANNDDLGVFLKDEYASVSLERKNYRERFLNREYDKEFDKEDFARRFKILLEYDSYLRALKTPSDELEKKLVRG